VYFVSETAQVELRSGRVYAPAVSARSSSPALWLPCSAFIHARCATSADPAVARCPPRARALLLHNIVSAGM
jgi:hypothetical protein